MFNPERVELKANRLEPGWKLLPGYRVWRTVAEGNPYVLDHGDKQIVLTNRSFREVDGLLDGLPGREIDRRIKSGQVPISVLDIGGGYESRAAIDLSWIYWHNLTVTNLDVFHTNQARGLEKVSTVLGDVADIPLPDGSFDLAYATYLLTYLPPERVDPALSEIVRVLKPGGSAILLGLDGNVATFQAPQPLF